MIYVVDDDAAVLSSLQALFYSPQLPGSLLLVRWNWRDCSDQSARVRHHRCRHARHEWR